MSAITPEISVQAPQQPPPIQTTAPEKKNNKILKIAVIGLVVMLIIILSEVGYLVFSGYGRTYFQLKSESQNNETTTPVSSPPPIPALSSEFTLSESSNLQQNKIDNFFYILEHLDSKDSFIEAITINATYKAIVTGTSQNENEDLGYKYKIEAKNDQGEVIGFQFSSQEIDSAEIYLISSDNNEEISFSDIEPGDNLTVKVASDLLDNSPDSKLVLEVERGN